MRLRMLVTTALTLALTLAVTAPAMAGGAGEGLAGETNDKIVTLFCLGIVLFFTLVVIFGSLIQGRLEKRKEARKAASSLSRVGW